MESFNLYGVLNLETGKLVNDITNPKHKFWEKKGSAESALQKYNNRTVMLGKYNIGQYKKEQLKVVTIKCNIEE